MKQENIGTLTDLHCHILPGVDDGAADRGEARALLDAQASQGVGQILFTPHFYAERMTPEDFLRNREEAARQMEEDWGALGITGALGAEVRMEQQLLDLELKPLALGQTGYLLLEWPFSATYPLWGGDVVRRVYDSGNRPVFAHVERYEFFFREPERLAPFLAEGALCQMNAATLLRESTHKQALKLIRDGYVHILSSDAHSMEHRPPRLAEAFRVVASRLGEKTAQRLLRNADDIFNGRQVTGEPPSAHRRRFLWFG